jgi:hypothetical protein
LPVTISICQTEIDGEISSSHGGEYEAQNLVGCTAVFLIECRPTFQMIALMMEAARTSETSVDIQLRIRQYIPEDSELQNRRNCCWCEAFINKLAAHLSQTGHQIKLLERNKSATIVKPST